MCVGHVHVGRVGVCVVKRVGLFRKQATHIWLRKLFNCALGSGFYWMEGIEKCFSVGNLRVFIKICLLWEQSVWGSCLCFLRM